ncbi:hypothetical protein PG990_012288 [Apiospora arundinis]
MVPKATVTSLSPLWQQAQGAVNFLPVLSVVEWGFAWGPQRLNFLNFPATRPRSSVLPAVFGQVLPGEGPIVPMEARQWPYDHGET